VETSWNCTLFDQRTFSCHTSTFDLCRKGSETCDVEDPTSIIQKVTTAMFGGRALNGSNCSETWLLAVKVLTS